MLGATISNFFFGISNLRTTYSDNCWLDLGHLRLSSSGVSPDSLANFSLNSHGLLWLESSYDFLSYLGNFGSLYQYPHRCRGFSLFGFLFASLYTYRNSNFNSICLHYRNSSLSPTKEKGKTAFCAFPLASCLYDYFW